MKILPTFEYERNFWEKGIQHIAGVDEVGRGCFAGPVVAAAVILPPHFENTYEIDDSKRLSAKKREALDLIIRQHAIAFAIAEVSVPVINEVGIGKAAQYAFDQAIKELSIAPDHILMDAFFIKSLSPSVQTPIIHGDRISVTIAAASIIAKVYRDNLMQKLHTQYELYDFSTNKGYGTKAHRDAIIKYGLTKMHRTSFHLDKYVTTR